MILLEKLYNSSPGLMKPPFHPVLAREGKVNAI